jgi:hypothetical protein
MSCGNPNIDRKELTQNQTTFTITDSVLTSNIKKQFLPSNLTGNKLTISDSDYKFLNILEHQKLSDFLKCYSLNGNIINKPDTIINDERGVHIGNKLTFLSSVFYWYNDSLFFAASIKDKEISLTNGLKIGMTENELKSLIFLQNNLELPRLDTVHIDWGQGNCGIDIILKNKRVDELSYLVILD